MKKDRFIFVAYDIKDDQVRQKVSRMLIYYGLVRVQYSLFRGCVSTKDKAILEEEMKKMVNKEDKMHIIDICEGCKKEIITIGEIPEIPQHLII